MTHLLIGSMASAGVLFVATAATSIDHSKITFPSYAVPVESSSSVVLLSEATNKLDLTIMSSEATRLRGNIIILQEHISSLTELSSDLAIFARSITKS
jgi:hypothetical protein